MNALPLISVIVPAYNCEQYVAKAINSILSQDYPNKEIIVVDDGSTDETITILKKYGEKINLIVQENSGPAAARNKGISYAKGEYITFLDADDLWLPEKLSTQAEYMMAHPGIRFVYHDWGVWESDSKGDYVLPVFDETSAKFEIDHEASGWLYNKLFPDSIIHTVTVMMHKSLVSEAGMFDLSFRIGEDYEYWFRLSRLTEMHKLKRKLSLYRSTENSITKRPHDRNYGYMVIQQVLKQWGRTGPDGTVTPRSEIRSRLAKILDGFGYLHYTKGNPRIAFKTYLVAIWNRPLYMPFWRKMLLSFAKSIL